MEKIWFIYIFGRVEGPFTPAELKNDLRLTPETLVWREGFDDWKPIKEVEELHDLFQEERTPPSDEASVDTCSPEQELALQIQKEPPFLLFWLMVILLMAGYLIYIYINDLS